MCLRQSTLNNALECARVCACVSVSEMNSLWPGCINSVPDWLQLSKVVTGEPEQDLIAIRELLVSEEAAEQASICVNCQVCTFTLLFCTHL